MFSSYPYEESDGRGERGEGTYSRRALFCYFGQGLGAYSRKGVHLLEHAHLFELIRYYVCSSEN